MPKINELFDMFLNKVEGTEKNKRKLQNLFIILCIGVLMLLIGGFFTKANKAPAKSDTASSVSKSDYLDEYDAALESKLQNILSQISGVGRVSVAITYSSSKEIVPAQDIKQNESNTNEKDREGGVRNTLETDTDKKVITDQQSETKPVILKEIPPEVKGVVVVADGASNERVKVDITKAVSTALGISLSKVQVFSRGIK